MIYGTIAGKGYTKSAFYDAFTVFRPTLFGQRDNQLHAQRKRIVGNGYSNQSINNMEQYIHASAGSLVDLVKWVHYFAFDVIGELAFSESFGMLVSGTMDEHAELIGHQLEFGSTLGLAPFLLPLTRSKYIPWPWVQRIQAGREKLKNLTRMKAERRKERKFVDRKDILGRLLEAFDSETGKTLDEIDIRTETFSSIVAGSDSTSAALAFTFLHILTHPTVKTKLVSELRAAFPYARSTDDAPPPSNAELGKLPYLALCIKESLRVTPPGTINLPRSVPEGGRMIGREFLPASTIVSTTLMAIHLNKTVFGSDADIYRPERWEDGDLEEMNKYYAPFSIGKRVCIGRNIAQMELIKLVGTLFLYFDIELANPKLSLNDMRKESKFFTRIVDPIWVTIRRPR